MDAQRAAGARRKPTAEQARRLCREALALERAGCFAIVLEAVPDAVARRITEAVRIPTIGIGAGASCDGQILVWHDLLGLSDEPVARFVKRYAELGTEILAGLTQYVADVRSSQPTRTRCLRRCEPSLHPQAAFIAARSPV
jgi:3-methyl-2-oxobutanoate hydroxymethyltransferase